MTQKKFNRIVKCKDASVLFKTLTDGQLEYVEKAIEEYEDMTPEQYSLTHDGYNIVAQWYEGCVTTEDLIEFMQQ